MSRRSTAFSVIIPTYDRPARLERCLDSLARLDFPRSDYEVVIGYDGGREDLSPLVSRYSRVMQLTLTVIARQGPAAARNAAVASSRGLNLAFIDDDCAARPDWLQRMAAHLAANPGAAIGGRVVNALADNRYARVSQTLTDHVYRWYHDDRRGPLRFFTTNNLAVPRRDFDLIGHFDPSFPFASEDRDWCDRALLAGYDLVHAHDAVVDHSHDLTLRTFLHQHFRYGQGAHRFHSARATRRGGRVKLEPVAFYIGMLTAPFETRERGRITDSLLMFVSQSASLVGFAHQLMRHARDRKPNHPHRQQARNSHPLSSRK